MTDSGKEQLVFWTVSLFLLFSGAAALVYQVVWVRLLGLSIGSTSVSISIVLAAFFFGIGTGSYFAGRILKKFGHALKIYLFAEAAIALSAVVLLPLLLHLDQLVSMFPVFGSGLLLKFCVVMVLLLIPTFFIGATFPLLISVAIHNRKEIGPKLAQFYAFNTIGALIGTILSAFVLIPHLGLDGAVYAAAAINILIVVFGLFLRNSLLFSGYVTSTISSYKTPLLKPFNNKALIVLFATGFSAIATEIGWMKYLIIYTGTTIYGFSLILAIFLAGIIIGSWFAKYKIISDIQPHKALFAGLLLLGAMLIFARVGLSLFPEIYEQINRWEVNKFIFRWSKYFIMFLLLMPATFLFGALFPIALKLYCPDIDRLHEHVGRAYAANIAAGIIGSLVAGFWLIPYFGTDILLSTTALIILFSSLLFISDIESKKIRLVWIGFIALFIPISIYLPHINYASMTDIVLRRGDMDAMSGRKQELHFLKEGKAGVISIVSYDDDACIMKLVNNGMSESWVDVCDQNHLLFNDFMLGMIPYFMNSSAKSAFVLGHGGGTTVRALAFTDLKTIDVVELEPVVVEAMRTVYKGKLPTDNDPRIRIDFNDARNTLLMAKRRYDIIISHPSHPWLSGAANILSKEFFEITKSRLATNGIHAQWLALFKLDVATLKSIFKAYTDTFPYAMSFVNFSTKEFLLFGSQAPMIFDYAKIQEIIDKPRINPILQRYSIDTPYGLMRYFALTRDQMVLAAGSAKPCTDTNLLTEVFFSSYKETKDNSFNTAGFLQNITNRLPEK